jgi:hypothetical protein
MHHRPHGNQPNPEADLAPSFRAPALTLEARARWCFAAPDHEQRMFYRDLLPVGDFPLPGLL